MNRKSFLKLFDLLMWNLKGYLKWTNKTSQGKQVGFEYTLKDCETLLEMYINKIQWHALFTVDEIIWKSKIHAHITKL